MWFFVNLKGYLAAYLVSCRNRFRQFHLIQCKKMEANENNSGRLSLLGDTSSGRRSPSSRKGGEEKNDVKQERKVSVASKGNEKHELASKTAARELKLESKKQGHSVEKKLHDIQNIIFHLANANEVAARLIAHEAKRWSVLDHIVEREAKKLAAQYRQLENTMQRIKLISKKQTIPGKERWLMGNLMDSMPRQDDMSLEMDIRGYEERLLSQYRKALLSGDDKIMELEAVKNTIHQKRRVLDYLDQLVGLHTTPGPGSANSSMVTTQALAVREPLRFPFVRNDFSSISQSGDVQNHLSSLPPSPIMGRRLSAGLHRVSPFHSVALAGLCPTARGRRHRALQLLPPSSIWARRTATSPAAPTTLSVSSFATF